MTKLLIILAFVLAVTGFLPAAPASAQNACFLQGSYVFSVAVGVPGPVAGIGRLVFTPPGDCVLGLPGTVSLTSTLFDGEVTGGYFVNGDVLNIPIAGAPVLGFLGQIQGGIARGFVFEGQASGVSLSGTALRAD